ncbi:hypothetical protein [Mesorhizobium sp. LjNodule214]|uniref:hypothetical protein n=1 Tax=Mesorhizobium sp. LjNodule214 TaxID=3342252 RepID=UPI003ECF4526
MKSLLNIERLPARARHFTQIPCFLPVIREYQMETGSPVTARFTNKIKGLNATSVLFMSQRVANGYRLFSMAYSSCRQVHATWARHETLAKVCPLTAGTGVRFPLGVPATSTS